MLIRRPCKKPATWFPKVLNWGLGLMWRNTAVIGRLRKKLKNLKVLIVAVDVKHSVLYIAVKYTYDCKLICSLANYRKS